MEAALSSGGHTEALAKQFGTQANTAGCYRHADWATSSRRLHFLGGSWAVPRVPTGFGCKTAGSLPIASS